MEPVAHAAFAPPHPAKAVRISALSAVAALALWFCAQHSYLLFHSIAEIFAIAVASAVFMISWSSRGYPEARPFVILGIGYLFVAILDVFHLLSYQGMGVLSNSQDDATRLWVAARALQAAATFAFALLASRQRTASHSLAFVVFGVATLLLLLSVFRWNVFPLCFVEGVGVTPFKKASEYAISAVFAVSIVLVGRNSALMDRHERRLLGASFALTIASELVLTLYVSAYGYENLIGHDLKIAAFFLAYQALFAGKIRSRLGLIGELERSKANLEASQAELVKANLCKRSMNHNFL